MGVSIATDAIMEEFFTYLDTVPGSEVYVQVESMNCMVEPQIDVLRYLAVKHPCVKGFAMDIEWYNHNEEDCGLRVSNERCRAWNEYIYKTWGPGYSLALKHYDAAHLPDVYRGGEEGLSNPVIWVDDTQNYGSWDGSHGGRYNPADVGDGKVPANGNDWSMFAEFFYPNRVIFQTGYQHDEQWSYAFDPVDASDPLYMRSHANKIAEVVNPDQVTGLAWVNFNRDGYPEMPTYNLARRGASSLLSTLASRTIAYLANYNGDSNNLIGGVWGFFSNAAGRERNLTNNPITYYDAMWAYNVRQYANALIAKGAAASNFTGNTNYSRFLGVEARSFDKLVSYRYDIVKANGYVPARDYDSILLLIDMYQGFSLTAACTFPTGVDALAGYTNGTVQSQAVTKYEEFIELVRMIEHPYGGFYATAAIKAPETIDIDKTLFLSYDITLAKLEAANMFKITAAFDNRLLYLAGSNLKVPGMSIVSEVYDVTSGVYTATILMNDNTFITSYDAIDVLNLVFAVDPAMKYNQVLGARLLEVLVWETLDGPSARWSATLDPASADTAIDNHIRWDLNDDGILDETDISTIMRWYYLKRAGDPGWDEPFYAGTFLFKPAKIFDVVADGIINTMDVQVIYTYVK